jgi:hypothetical protein
MEGCLRCIPNRISLVSEPSKGVRIGSAEPPPNADRRSRASQGNFPGEPQRRNLSDALRRANRECVATYAAQTLTMLPAGMIDLNARWVTGTAVM